MALQNGPCLTPSLKVPALIIEYIRYDLKQHDGRTLVDAYRVAADALRASPECIGFDLARCDEDAACFVLRILWTSAQDHMKGFRGGPNFLPFFAAIKPFVGEIVEMRHYSGTEVAWTRHP